MDSKAWHAAQPAADAELIPDGRVDPVEEFDSAISQGLDLLEREIGFGAWSCIRHVGDDWIMQHVTNRGRSVPARECVRWHESIGARMMALDGPAFAPDVSQVPAYVDAPVRRDFDIGAYIGVALRRRDQSVIGTLCAVDRQSRPPLGNEQQATVMYVARMIASLIDREYEIANHYRAIELEGLAHARNGDHDLLNEAGWAQALAIEERARRVLASTAAVAYLRPLSGNGAATNSSADGSLDTIGAVVRATAPETVTLAASDDERGLYLLLPETDVAQARDCMARISAQLAERGIDCIDGLETARHDRPLKEAAIAARNAAFYR